MFKIKKYNENLNSSAKDPLDFEEFYNLMQIYRHQSITNQTLVSESFNDIKNYIRDNFILKDKEIVEQWLLEQDSKKYNI